MEEQIKTTAGQGFGVASLVLGIIALLIALIPCIGLFALIPGIIAVIFAIIGLTQANKGNGQKGVIIAGLIVSILSTLLAAIWLTFFSAGGALLEELSEHEGFEEVIEEIVDDLKDEKNWDVTYEEDEQENEGSLEDVLEEELEELEGEEPDSTEVDEDIKEGSEE